MWAKIRHYINRHKYHKAHNMLSPRGGGYGACGQDILIAELLGHKRDGVFFDIGANDGVTISNSYYFEKELGWSGVAVEPLPAIFSSLEHHRNCHLVNGCVTPVAGTAKFLEMEGQNNMLSTLEQNNRGLTARRLRNNAKRHKTGVKEIDVACFTFSSLVDKFDIKAIDFLSVDTEGGELEILKSINFNATPVSIISVENNYYKADIRTFLEAQGFAYYGTFKIDEIYILKP
ncbi:MAG: FkbM family methyltransferase [Maricaulaceae bacterium]